ncbi:3'(2'),5'-bisphosphate nucleotidase 1-like isoform X1 [Ctenocephalides felis]|uniref:3'(2'),5'-bisphosphate nucleotidase 1-like isoform X1 n=2 Tax=Ctenocephalides felis TaxID=7515 RepID=UPI000E6E2929|nr:3'(2'),5'-bisphosphate nucleotidase 1-like isoform X1 [Ctenocephalides felis]
MMPFVYKILRSKSKVNKFLALEYSTRILMSYENHPVLLRVLAHSVAIADMAGTLIRNVLKAGELGVVHKGKDDPQTEADRSAQRCIMASLLKSFPDLTVIGEEGQLNLNIPEEWIVTTGAQDVLERKCLPEHSSIQEKDIVVWVDPLDGTQEFTKGNLDNVTVLIGIAVDGKAIGGVIHQPFFENSKGRTIWGLRGIGFSGITLSNRLQNKLVITTSRSHTDSNVIAAINELQPDEVLHVGGAGFKVIQLLDGSANAYVFASPGCKKWDTCAPEAILEIAGGMLTDVFGNKYVYDKDVQYPNSKGVIATAPCLNHTDLINKMSQEIKSKLMN